MIIEENGKWQCVCEICERKGEKYDKFAKCIVRKHSDGFKCKEINGKLLDFCFECVESEGDKWNI